MQLPSQQVVVRFPERVYRAVWRLFHELVAGGYPDDEKTMGLARRSIEKQREH